MSISSIVSILPVFTGTPSPKAGPSLVRKLPSRMNRFGKSIAGATPCCILLLQHPAFGSEIPGTGLLLPAEFVPGLGDGHAAPVLKFCVAPALQAASNPGQAALFALDLTPTVAMARTSQTALRIPPPSGL